MVVFSRVFSYSHEKEHKDADEAEDCVRVSDGLDVRGHIPPGARDSRDVTSIRYVKTQKGFDLRRSNGDGGGRRETGDHRDGNEVDYKA